MKLFQRLPALVKDTCVNINIKLTALVVTSFILTASNGVLADQRHNNPHASSKYNAGSGTRFNASNYSNNHSQNYSSKYAPSRQRQSGFANSRARNRHFGNNFGNTHNNVRWGAARYPYRPNNNWSVALNLGNHYPNTFRSWYSPGYSYGLGIWQGSNWSHQAYNTHTRVIYKEPTVVYVNNTPSRADTNIYRTTSTRAVQSDQYQNSLLRDVDGNCFERSYDSNGYETRIQLPNSACRF